MKEHFFLITKTIMKKFLYFFTGQDLIYFTKKIDNLSHKKILLFSTRKWTTNLLKKLFIMPIKMTSYWPTIWSIKMYVVLHLVSVLVDHWSFLLYDVNRHYKKLHFSKKTNFLHLFLGSMRLEDLKKLKLKGIVAWSACQKMISLQIYHQTYIILYYSK